MATFTENEYAFLLHQSLGRLATTGPNGPQNHPVWYRVNGDTGTVDVGGIRLTGSQKYRNVRADPRVSLVVDEPDRPGESDGRGLEIRGRVEIVRLATPLFDGFSNETMRIHPRRILAWNLDGPGYNIRDVRA
ncbi:MAG TPA: PPOX class F420-dependent oxidoreductase [Streptosporangiales bacterium]